jgi:hypothetical protein
MNLVHSTPSSVKGLCVVSVEKTMHFGSDMMVMRDSIGVHSGVVVHVRISSGRDDR